MADTANPDYEDWNPDTDSQPPIPIPEPKKQGIVGNANFHSPQKEGESTERRIREWAQVSINFVLFVVGIIAVCIYGGQLQVMKGQLGEVVKQYPEMQKQATAAEGQMAQARADSIASALSTAVQIEILRNQLEQSREAFRTDERSWVVINSIEKTQTIPPDPPFGTTFKFSIFLKNVGKTVARNVRIHVQNPGNFGSFMEDRHEILMFQDQLFHLSGINKRFVMPDNPGPQMLAPGTQSPVPVFSAGQEPKRNSDGEFRYSLILGRIDYDDAFGVRHWMHFCYVITNSNGDLGNCKYGNDQDSNQEKTPAKPN